jgi:hypothetical protein
MSIISIQAKPDAYNDPFDHLCRSLFKNHDDLFVMLTAYFDDSGNDSVAVVAGYLATVHMWELFSERWTSLLSKYGVTQSHRADLENFQGEFRHWNPERRTEFVKKAHAIIRKYTYTAIGLSLIKGDFDAVIPPKRPRGTFWYFWLVRSGLPCWSL